MHPLHTHIAARIARSLRERRVVVWYDPAGEYRPFIEELRGAPRPAPEAAAGEAAAGEPAAAIAPAGHAARLLEYTGSLFQLRMLAEPFVQGDTPDDLVIYLPGVAANPRESVLMELECAGARYEEDLRRAAGAVLRAHIPDAAADELLARAGLGYRDLAHAAAEAAAEKRPSLLKAIFAGCRSDDEILAEWLMNPAHDTEIEAKEAQAEPAALLAFRLGLALPPDMPLARQRAVVRRALLAAEFLADLRCEAPAMPGALPIARQHEPAVRALARRMRAGHPGAYETAADAVERELRLAEAGLPADALGSIDTFRFEERALLEHCAATIADGRFADGRFADGRFAEALAVVDDREESFWLDRDVHRKAQWEACRRMAELGLAAARVRDGLGRMAGAAPEAWIQAFAAPEGWHHLGRAQRALETWIARLEHEPDERALGVVRRLFEETSGAMAQGFTRALEGAGWSTGATLHQTRIFAEIAAGMPKPMAYIVVDALRFEMGAELAGRLPTSSEVALRAAAAALPTITPIGMAALLPGAAENFCIEARGGRFGARIGEHFLPDLPARRAYAAAHLPGLVDIGLDELLSLGASALAAKVKGAQVVLVRSQEIDHAGETGFTRAARRVMDEVIGDVASAVGRLARAGIEHAVITADHGHLFFAAGRDESMRIASPGGDVADLHRRCWIGRGGATPAGCVRLPATTLGYASDLELVLPSGTGVFRAGGDLAYHHGGASLEEMVVPVLTVRAPARPAAAGVMEVVTVGGVPGVITNRIFSVTMTLGGDAPSMFQQAAVVRPILEHDGRRVGTVGMEVAAELDRDTGAVTLRPETTATLAFQLSDDTVPVLRIVVLDPATDAELYRSPNDIPVRLGV